MPIYLCQPGSSSKEPWRHGVQVYERPFPLFDPNHSQKKQKQQQRGQQPSSSSSRSRHRAPPPGGGGVVGSAAGTVVGATAAGGNTTGGLTGSSSSSGPEQIIVVTPLHSEKYLALVRYLSEKSSGHDKVLIFTNGGSTSNNRNSSSSSGGEAGHSTGRQSALSSYEITQRLLDKGIKAVNIRGTTRGEMEQSGHLEKLLGGEGFVFVIEEHSEEAITSLLKEEQQQQQQPNSPPMHMIINYSLPSTMDTYLARLSLTTTANTVVTFLHPQEQDLSRTEELVEILRGYGQEVPRELEALLSTTTTSGGEVGIGGDNLGYGGERGRPIRAVPLRGDSHSPVPDYNSDTTDRVVAATSAAAAADSNNNNEGRRARQQRFFQNREATTSLHSSDDDEFVPMDNDNHSGGTNNNNNNASGGASTTNSRAMAFRRSNSVPTSELEQYGRSSTPTQPTTNTTTTTLPTQLAAMPPSMPATTTPSPAQQQRPTPVRRVRHAELVLVDQCLVAFGRIWLRLRWPGEQGGFGGFVALSRVDEMERRDGSSGRNVGMDGVVGCLEEVDDGLKSLKSGGTLIGGDKSEENENDEVVLCQEVSSTCAIAGSSTSTTSIIPLPVTATTTATLSSLLCQETNVHYPTSVAMRLLPLYDDGLNKSVVVDNEGDDHVGVEEVENHGEPVFCRICREGLHDVNYDLETTQEGSSGAGNSTSRSAQGVGSGGGGAAAILPRSSSEASARTNTSSTAAIGNARDSNSSLSTTQEEEEPVLDDAVQSSSATAGTSTSTLSSSPPSFNHLLANLPPIVLHHPTAENPLLAPCACTGTMAFVHYLCIEQWRCRSRHPGARNGLNCETCGAEYTLPPPPSRPASRHDLMGGAAGMGGGGGNLMDQDDWLDAMPPHVLAALRRPHPAWQLGAAVVRRRWLRPIVPVVVSPLVALYCRARRTLKKRGVSRRRWACSLCRRRARWKCVRCLRSYYCSRQCQNVSWHIVHKHVCYKPVRFWWSVVVYALGIVVMVPGLIENFPIYDAMVTLLPINFIALGIIGGGIASALKRSSGIDIRGRVLEMIVVVLTCLLTGVSSGLVRGYFGNPSQCWGVFASSSISAVGGDIGSSSNNFFSSLKGPFYPSILNIILVEFPLKQIQLWYQKWDFILSKFGFVSRRFICVPDVDGNTDYSSIGCSPTTRTINPRFYLEEDDGTGDAARCSADVSLVMGIWFMALAVLFVGNMYRQLRGAVRRNNLAGAAVGGGGAHRGRRRPHQD